MPAGRIDETKIWMVFTAGLAAVILHRCGTVFLVFPNSFLESSSRFINLKFFSSVLCSLPQVSLQFNGSDHYQLRAPALGQPR
jgi:hypothetical protein